MFLVFVEVNILKKHSFLFDGRVCGSQNLKKKMLLYVFNVCGGRNLEKAFVFMCFWQWAPGQHPAGTRPRPAGARENSRAYNKLSKNPIKLKLS